MRRTSLAAETDYGWLAGYGEGGRLRAVSFGFPDGAAASAWRDAHDAGPLSGEWAEAVDALRGYLAGEVFSLDGLPREDPPGLTPFARAVRQVVSKIPYGRTRTYGEVAELAGRPRAARAVGSVMAANTLVLLLPCHRVVPASGKPGNYNSPGGVAVKLRLLEMERRVSGDAA